METGEGEEEEGTMLGGRRGKDDENSEGRQRW